MDNWIKLLVPLIALAVWILSNMAKNREEPRRNQRSPTPPDMDSPPRPRRAPTDVDRFLEEVRRRRESGEKKSPPLLREAPASREQTRSRPVSGPVAEPVVRPHRPAPTSEEGPKQRSPRRSAAQEAVPVAKIVSPPPLPQLTPAQVAEQASIAALGQPGQMAAKDVSPAIKQLFGLLKSPQTMQTAVLLREILEAPRCRRRHR